MSTDQELFAAWAAGDNGAGSELFDRHFESLYRFFRNKAPEAVEDLIQETMFACVRAKDSFRGDSSFRTYLFTVARHELYRHYEKRVRSQGNEDIGSRSIADLGTSPSAAFAKRREHDLLLRGLRAIPLDLQVALELHFWQSLSGPEMAEVLGIPEGTVRSRIRRAKEALAEKMNELVASADRAMLTTSLADLDGWARDVGAELEASD